MTLRNQVILVDRNNNELGMTDKMDAHKKGLLHRAFSVMLYRYNNGQLEFLLQKRAESKYHAAGLWTNTCCSHPQPEDSLITSAKKRLLEELVDIDIDNINLQEIASFIYRAEFSNGLIEHEFDHVLIAEYSATPEYINSDEIEVVNWFTLDNINNKYNDLPSGFTPWFKRVYDYCCDYLI